MEEKSIHNFAEYRVAPDACGFSITCGNACDVFSPMHRFADDVVWFTGVENMDPWQRRVRALRDRNDIMSRKVFFPLP